MERPSPLNFFNSLGETTNKSESTDKSDNANEAGFKSAKTRKKERKKEYDEKREKAKKAIKAEDRGSDSRKEKRFAASKLAREERKARANDRKQAWAEKQVAKGKYENKEAAMARFEGLREITVKSPQRTNEIIGIDNSNTDIEAQEGTQDEVTENIYHGAMPVADNEKIGANIIPGKLQ